MSENGISADGETVVAARSESRSKSRSRSRGRGLGMGRIGEEREPEREIGQKEAMELMTRGRGEDRLPGPQPVSEKASEDL